MVALDPGDVILTTACGGGGWGPAWERDARAVLFDVQQGKVSLGAAADDYGVVIRDGAIDETATAARRARLAANAKPGVFAFNAQREAYEREWTSANYDALTEVLATLPVHWRHYMKKRIFAALEEVPAHQRRGDGSEVRRAFELAVASSRSSGPRRRRNERLMDIQFDNQAVIVTGAARGIGGGIVEGFVERGARVWACDLLEDELAALKARARPQRGGALETRKVDLTQSAEVDGFVREVERACGAVDVLVHVAGGVRGQVKRPVEEVSDDDWRAIQAVNVEGAFFASRAVAPGMKKKASGRIIVIASRAGLGVSLTGIQSYATAKAAQLGLVRQLAHELGPSGITVNAVAPGFLRTSPDYERQWQSYGPDGQKAMIERVAMRRLGEPQDIAHAVMFLASPYASWITGQVLPVTGSPLA